MSKHQGDILFSTVAGMVGGLAKLYAHPTFIAVYINRLFSINWQGPAKLAEAGIAALLCGFLGAWGKHLFTLVMKKFIHKKSKKI
ncbi:MAG TPA: hypothetical protein VHB48_01595 [Chitinophagaceae bacterium]|jgi:hypothetical protein|nr:hypothetical protein [Chitinophagaceae bacterium]